MRCDPESLLRLGRRDENEETCSLWWQGDGVRFLFGGTWLRAEIEAPEGDQAAWMAVLAEDVLIARFPLQPGKHLYPILEGMEAAAPHEITLIRDTQPVLDKEPVRLHCLETDGSLSAAEPRKRLIEFLGDSLTVGEGAVGPESARDWRMAWMSQALAFPTFSAGLLQADKRVIAVSGWGASCGWDGDPASRIGLIYERLCARIASGDRPYAFREREADAVVINLGTNDAGALRLAQDPAAHRERFERNARELIALVRSRQPGAHILWAYGLCGDELAPEIRRAVDAIRASGDGRVSFLPLSGSGGDTGALLHPGRKAHERAAEEIARALRSLWKDD